MKGTFCVYCIMRPMAHHIEKYRSEKLFDENDMTCCGKMNCMVG